MKRNGNFDPDPMNARSLLCFECGCECYEYGEMYTFTKRVRGSWEEVLICPECLEAFFDELPLIEKAELIGSKKVIVGEALGLGFNYYLQ